MAFRVRARHLAVPLLLAAAPAAAQTVEGVVTDAAGQPLPGVLVLLVDGDGRQRTGALTGEAGRFVVRAPGPGTYELRGERVGLRTARQPGLALADGEARTLSLRMAEAPVALDALAAVSASAGVRPRCDAGPRAGPETAALWEEARKALTNAAWTEERQGYRFEAATFSRDLQPATLAVVREERKDGVSVGRSPFRSLDAASLSRHGYARQIDGATYYYAPDAAVLLSDEFLRDHCFHVTVEGAEAPGLVGLGFTPVRGRRVPEVSGTLWMDRAGGVLKHLEYRYRNLEVDVPTDSLGGRVDFERLPTGAWIVRRWAIRMPSVGLEDRLGPGVGRVSNRRAERLWGIREEGGEVLRVLHRNGTPVVAVPRGTVAGVVWDSSAGGPVAGARVFLSGTQHQATSDSAGRFRIDGVAQGAYTLGFVHDGAALRGATPSIARVAVNGGDTAVARLALVAAPPEAPVPAGRTAAASRSGVAALPRRAATPPAERSPAVAAFYLRAQGGTGRFFTRADIEALRPVRTADLFRSVRELEVIGGAVRHRSTASASPRGASGGGVADRAASASSTSPSPCGGGGDPAACRPGSESATGTDCPVVYVDGVVSPTAGDLSSIDPAALEGVEVYPRPALAPAEFRRMGAECPVILLWLREGDR
jgi:hypothetical protein